DGGTTWDPGTATSFELLPGTYDADDVQVRQTDAAGNTSDEGLLGPVTVDVSLDAVNDSTTLDMGAVSEVDYAPQVTSDVEVIGLLESNEGADASAAVTVQADRSGELRIEISQTALVAVGDAYRLDVIDSDGNIVYQGATATSPLVGQVAGLQVLGLTGDNTLVATVTGLPPGTYSVVIHNDSSALTDLLDTDGGGVSVQELGDAGVVVGADNQSVVLTAVSNALGPLGPAAVLLLDPVLTGLNGLPVTGIVGPLTGILNTVGFLGSVDDVVDAIATALLSNTLTLLQETTITTTLTEYEFATETVTGNVITGDAGLGVDDIGAGATITQVVNSDGTIAPVPAGGSVNIAGEYGELTLNSDGSYTYNAYGAPMSVGEADVFTYTLSDGGASDTATLTITLDGEAVVAAGDSASASFVWENVEEVVTDSHNLSGALTAQTTNSPTFTLDAATLASGTVVVSAGLAGVAMSGNAVLQEETSPGVWTNVPGTTDSFSVVIAVLGAELASIDIGALTLDPGNYRVHVTLNGSLAALAINVATDLTLTHTDQFVLDQATGATGNVLDNDAAGATTTELQVQNDADLYVGGPVTVQGTYGTLTVQADGSYSYVPDTGVAYFDTPQVDSFNYQLVHPNGQISQAVLDVTVEPSGAGIAGFAGFSLMSFGFGDDTIPLGDFSAAPDSVLSSEAPDLSGIVEPPASDDSTSVDALLDQFIDTQDAGTEPDSTSSGAPDTSPSPEPTMEDPLGYLTPVPIDDQHLQHPTVV
ncbi:MAG TPA: VCBS domain-containing protein, partial [Devosia sp.]|uniref:beta strand repeat-containing protein n=1 Tax=Devosia sp. TaxID=1871048 RepID=UPI002DDCEF75